MSNSVVKKKKKTTKKSDVVFTFASPEKKDFRWRNLSLLD